MAGITPCPKCGSGNTYVLVNGMVVCRTCGYDDRKQLKGDVKNEH